LVEGGKWSIIRERFRRNSWIFKKARMGRVFEANNQDGEFCDITKAIAILISRG